MNAEILCVGTELLLGDIVNTNAAFLARELASLGINLYYQSVAGDNPERLRQCLEIAFSRVDLVITSGGLGPTYDDLTKETVAAYFGRKMEMHEPSLQQITRFFESRGRTMTPNNAKQAMMPVGATVLPNSCGTAPGLAIEQDGKTVIMLPGPPREIQPMFLDQAVPFLKKFSDHTLVSHTIHIFGLGESAVEDMLKTMMVESANPTVAPYAKEGEVQLRVTAAADNEAGADAMIAPVIQEIIAVLGEENVYGVDVGSLQNAAVLALREKGLKAATAESCTAGYVSKRLTEVAGSSAVFDCGITSYSNEIKQQLLGVSGETLAQYGAVSRQTALEMARGVRKLSGAQIGVSTTGIAGPDGGTAEKPVGLVYVGISCDRWEDVLELRLGRGYTGERELVRYLAASHALSQIIKATKKY